MRTAVTFFVFDLDTLNGESRYRSSITARHRNLADIAKCEVRQMVAFPPTDELHRQDHPV